MAVDIGMYISPVFRPYLDDETLMKLSTKVEKNEERFRKLLNPVEGWLMTIQSLLVWEKPTKSILMLAGVNIAFWIASAAANRIIAVIAWGTMLLFTLHFWKKKIWPTIRVPPKYKEDDEGWTPLHARLMSVPEISQCLAENFVVARLYIKALKKIRKKHSTAFLVLSWFSCSCLWLIGHYFSGFMTAYVIVMSMILWPCVTYNKIFHKMYIRVEPYMMELQYKLKFHKKHTHNKEKKKVEIDPSKDFAETDSDCDPNDYPPPSDPAANAALARVITDSEDESQSPRSISREPSLGYNSDLENLDEDSELPDPVIDDVTSPQLSFIPDVSQMPDFENVCENSNTFMLEADLMPSLDECDRSRNPHAFDPHHYENTASESESLPYDDVPIVQGEETTHSTGIAGLMTQSLAATLASTLTGLGKLSQSHDDSALLRHPNDRLGDAGGSDSSDSDFEVLDKGELYEHNVSHPS